jgi:hypothetical protein
MKKKVIISILFFCILILVSANVLADDNNSNQDYPYLFPTKVLSSLTNEIYDHFKNDIEQADVDSVFKALDKEEIEDIGKNLLFLFFVAGVFVEMDRLDQFNIYVFIKLFIIFILAYLAVENTHYLISISNQIKNSLINSIPLVSKAEIINYEWVVRQFESSLPNDVVVSNVTLVFTTVAYTLMTYSIFLSIMLIYVILLIRQFKILLLQLIAPLMFSGLGSLRTASFTLKYIKKYLMVYLQIVFIQFIIAVYLKISVTETNLLFVFLQSSLLIISIVLGNKLISLSIGRSLLIAKFSKHKIERTIKYVKTKVVKNWEV